MSYNICDTCGACDGRAGLLIDNGVRSECVNCRDTRKDGKTAIFHSYLIRTTQEIGKTVSILKENKNDN